MKKYNQVRDSLGADWIFLSDPDRALLHELEMVDRTDSIIQPTDDIFLSSECSQKNDGDIRELADASAHLPSIHFGHHNIQDDQIGLLSMKLAQSFLAVRGLKDPNLGSRERNL